MVSHWLFLLKITQSCFVFSIPKCQNFYGRVSQITTAPSCLSSSLVYKLDLFWSRYWYLNKIDPKVQTNNWWNFIYFRVMMRVAFLRLVSLVHLYSGLHQTPRDPVEVQYLINQIYQDQPCRKVWNRDCQLLQTPPRLKKM